MKKVNFEITLFLTSVFMYLVLTITAAVLSSTITSWNPDVGKFGTAVSEYGLIFPFVLTYTLLVASISILVNEYYYKPKKQKEANKQDVVE